MHLTLSCSTNTVLSHLQAHRIDQHKQNTRNVDDDAEKCSDCVERVQSRGIGDDGEVYQPKAPTMPV